MMLVTTEQASAMTGLSEWELRRGWKEGIYPAIQVGRGERSRRLRWNPEMLEQAIRERMSGGSNGERLGKVSEGVS